MDSVREYFYVNSKGRTKQSTWRGSYNDEARWKFGNCFETREQAHEAKRKMKGMFKKIAEKK